MKTLLAWLGQKIGRRSLATRLTLWMLLVAALTVVVQFYYLNRQNRTEIETLQTNTLINEARTLADRLDALVRNETSRITNLSLSRAAQEFISVRPAQRSTLFTPTLADFSNFLASNPFYRAVLLLDKNGEVLISTDGSYVGQNFGRSYFFQQAINSQPVMSDPSISPRDRQAVIWLAAPVHAESGREPAGVVAVTLSPEELWNTVESYKIGQNGYAILLDEYGVRLAHGHNRSYIFRSLVPISPEDWQQIQASNRFGPLTNIEDTGSWPLWEYVQSNPLPPLTVAYLNEQGQRVYYSAARLQTRVWTVVAMLPEDEILAPASRVTFLGLGTSLALILLLSITVIWMAKRLVRPVPELVEAAGKIAQGDLSTPVSVQAGSELGELAENFETMRRRLKDTHDQLAAWAGDLEHRVATRSQELAALSEVVAFAGRSQSRSELLETALNLALRAMDAEMGGIWVADGDDYLRLYAQQGFNPKLSHQTTTFAPGQGLPGQVQATVTSVTLEDINQAPLLARAVTRERTLHAFAAVPLRIHERSLGVLGVFSRSRRPFSPEAVSLANSIAQQIALALDNMSLLEQVEAQAQRVARLQERERIAAEIHDSMAQTHGYIYLQVDSLAEDSAAIPTAQIKARLIALREVIDNLSQETRRFIAQLRDVPPPPPTRLLETVDKEIERLKPELTLRVKLNLTQAQNMTLPETTSAELSRIVGEAVRNAQYHGKANEVGIEFEQQNGTACLSIRDDGVGFDPHHPPTDGRSHFGLSVMQARAARIGGSLTVNSKPGMGTQIQIFWPVNQEETE